MKNNNKCIGEFKSGEFDDFYEMIDKISPLLLMKATRLLDEGLEVREVVNGLSVVMDGRRHFLLDTPNQIECLEEYQKRCGRDEIPF